MGECPSQAEVRASFNSLGLLLGRRFDVCFFEGGYTYHVISEPGCQSVGIAGIDVVGGPAQGAAAHQQAHAAWLVRQWKDVERGIFFYGNGRKGAFCAKRRLHGDGGLHG